MARRQTLRSSSRFFVGLGLAISALGGCDHKLAGDDLTAARKASCVEPTLASAAISKAPLAELARLAVFGDEGERVAAIVELRSAGPSGLEAFIAVHRDALAAEHVALASSSARGLQERDGGLAAGLQAWLRGPFQNGSEQGPTALDIAIDAICQQHGCRHTQLYWYTDLDRAVAAARASHRPILSLRLLGDLDEALSCANSRFFRTILYPAVAPWLRERFVLHWSSERPVPVITIDYRDGRQLVRTITGNSVHYVLDSDGQPIDVLPGLMAPAVFQRLLERDAALALSLPSGATERDRALRTHHRQRLAELDVAWAAELRAIGRDPAITRPPTGPRSIVRKPTAAAVNLMALGKSSVEMPLLEGLGLGLAGEVPAIDPEFWNRLAERHLGESALSQASLRAMNALAPVDASMRDATVRSLAADTLVNEHQLHRTVHGWFAEEDASSVGLKALNQRIYSELLLMPASDRDLGLAPLEVYSGLAAGGWSTVPVHP